MESAAEAARNAKETLELAFQMSNILETGLDRHTLSLLIALCDRGVNPEALAALVRELSPAPRAMPPDPSTTTNTSSSSRPNTHHGDKGKKFEPGASKQKSPLAAARLPAVTPLSERCLRFLKLERIKDYLLRRQAEKNEYKVDDLRGSPMNVENLEELIGESHAIVSLSVGPEYHIRILSLVVKDRLERGCAILMHNKVKLVTLYEVKQSCSRGALDVL
ncbi:regulatory subunit 4 [Musa troglodytarum]|uniref:Regulatory subunit 4 n=1 Tax=Musa troglodytarum TaxID=320322 RepID=A0A9E7HUJ0_9LILI|nr:regulatory subunit 4 [Musa troglodytarum]